MKNTCNLAKYLHIIIIPPKMIMKDVPPLLLSSLEKNHHANKLQLNQTKSETCWPKVGLGIARSKLSDIADSDDPTFENNNSANGV